MDHFHTGETSLYFTSSQPKMYKLLMQDHKLSVKYIFWYVMSLYAKLAYHLIKKNLIWIILKYHPCSDEHATIRAYVSISLATDPCDFHITKIRQGKTPLSFFVAKFENIGHEMFYHSYCSVPANAIALADQGNFLEFLQM